MVTETTVTVRAVVLCHRCKRKDAIEASSPVGEDAIDAAVRQANERGHVRVVVRDIGPSYGPHKHTARYHADLCGECHDELKRFIGYPWLP